MKMRMPKLINWDRIEVFWVDSMSTGGWRSLKQHEDEITDKALKHKSCGYFYKLTKESLCIVQSVSDYDELKTVNMTELLQIPIVAIKKINRL